MEISNHKYMDLCISTKKILRWGFIFDFLSDEPIVGSNREKVAHHALIFRWCLKLLSVNSFFKPSRIDQWFIKYSKCWKIKTPIYPCLWQIYCARPLLWIFISIKIKVTWFKPMQPSGTKSRPNTMQLRKLFATDSISSILGHLVSLIMRYNRISKIVIIFLKLMSQVFRADLLLDEMQSRMIKLLFHDGTTKGN